MRGNRSKFVIAGVLALSLVGAACSNDDDGGGGTTGGGGTSGPGGECTTPDPVKLQLQWFIQAQFAGYFAAQEKGFYDDWCLDVEIIEGGVDIVPQQQLADGAVDFALAWVPKALASREAGANIVDIAQVFQRSGTLQVSFKDAGITSPADFAGQDDRELGVRQRVRDLRRAGGGGAGPRERRLVGAAAVRHAGPALAATSTRPRP